jgi:hypothetical protein
MNRMKYKIIGITLLVLIIGVLANFGGSMNQVQITKEYNFDEKLVWAQWSDISKISDFHPDLISSPIISSKTSGLGTQRKVTTTDGKELIHEIFAYNDTQQTLAFTFKADFLPIKDGRCFISIKSKRAGKATLDFKVTMKPKFGFLGGILGKLVLEPKLAAGGRNLLNGLESYLIERYLKEMGE